MSYQFRPAQRSEAKPLIGLYAESGCGKTLSSLLVARGFVGPNGKIGMIETESGRGEAYSDPTEYPELAWSGHGRNYLVTPMRDNFSSKEYAEAITASEQEKLDALIIDSASHEWEGAGGVLATAAANQASGKAGVLAWQAPKLDHQRNFMLRFMQCSIPLVILNMRAKYPMEEKLVDGKKKWVRSEKLEPKQADDILYEMFVHGWIGADHNFHMTKCTSKSLEPVFSSVKPLSLASGRALAAWAGGGSAKPESPPEAESATQAPAIRNRILEEAEIAAKRGREAIKVFMARIPQDSRNAIEPERARLWAIALEADREMSP